jgi:hypothetical protein
MPDGFQFVGISVVESLAQMQEYLWTLQNQRLDALRLLTNVISIIRSDVDDPDSFEFYPGAQWIVEDPGQVSQLQIDGTAAQITLEAESMMKGDLQNIMGGLAFVVLAPALERAERRQARASSRRCQLSSGGSSLHVGLLRSERSSSSWGRCSGRSGSSADRQEAAAPHGPPAPAQGEFNVSISVMDEHRPPGRSPMALVNLAGQMVERQAGLNIRAFFGRVMDAYGIGQPEFFAGGPQAAPQRGRRPRQDHPGGCSGAEPDWLAGQTNPGLARDGWAGRWPERLARPVRAATGSGRAADGPGGEWMRRRPSSTRGRTGCLLPTRGWIELGRPHARSAPQGRGVLALFRTGPISVSSTF